jgi:riboflavin transporter FmnP
MRVVDVILLVAVVIGLGSSVWPKFGPRSRTPLALLGGLAVSSLLTLAGVPFNPVAWLTIDFTIIAVILTVKTTWLEKAIIALFLPSWYGYMIDTQLGSDISSVATAIQLVLTTPFRALHGRAKRASAHSVSESAFDLKVGVGHGL